MHDNRITFTHIISLKDLTIEVLLKELREAVANSEKKTEALMYLAAITMMPKKPIIIGKLLLTD